ncbi:BtrH N-terminal domain-containing protein [Pseudonocardia sp. N23]|uniref:BtrH N-terminal domain-containing protein n=1 Tax=Pseudonocardia sp. N23 TaxID=1987376 RepID=UPI000BFB3DCF|nr:BtrH N-terminal domain-containing protein [Pseudonocardia sp. N23]
MNDPMDTTHDGGVDTWSGHGTEVFDPGTLHDAGVPDTYETVPADGSGFTDGGTGPGDGSLVQIAPGVEGRLVDADSDGTPDAVVVDLDGDGDLDTTITRDAAGTFTVGYDDDGDGMADRYETMTKAQLDAVLPGVTAALDPAGTHHGTATDTPPPPVEDGRVVGDPEEFAQVWFQQAVNGFCMPASVAQIVSVYTGEALPDEMAIVQGANQLQLWSVGADGVPGMTSENAVTLLEAYGIPVELTHELIGDHALQALDQALADGRGVIITIDSGEVWYGEASEDHVLDHAVVVAGIDYDRGVVLLSDPGNPSGNLEEVPIEVFMDAWADSRYEMITCDEPAAALTDGPGGAGGAGSVAGGGAAASGEGLDAVFTGPWAMLPVTVTVTVSVPGPGSGA